MYTATNVKIEPFRFVKEDAEEIKQHVNAFTKQVEDEGLNVLDITYTSYLLDEGRVTEVVRVCVVYGQILVAVPQ